MGHLLIELGVEANMDMTCSSTVSFLDCKAMSQHLISKKVRTCHETLFSELHINIHFCL